MQTNTFPTKGNLIAAKNTLRLSKQGYELMDKKRNVLIREIMELNEKANQIQSEIDTIFTEAYKALQNANISMGISRVERFSYGIPLEESVNVRSRSIMGVEIPMVTYVDNPEETPSFGFGNTTAALDEAYIKFKRVKELTVKLSMVENAAYRLAVSIKKTQKRANALKNITIPRYENLVKTIQDTLEERERDEFTRLKVIKNMR